MTLKNNRAPLPIHFKLCASFDSHWWIQTGVTVRKRPIWAKISNFLARVTLKFGGWALKTNRAPLLFYFKRCASFCSHMSIQTGVTVRKGLNWVITSVTLTIDLWPWPLAWTSLLSMVVTPENFMIRWQEHSKKVWQINTGRQTEGQTDGRTNGRTEITVLRAAWSQLKCF